MLLASERPFTPRDWYWRADDGRVFASARKVLVAAADAGYQAADAAGAVTRWPVDGAGAQTLASLQAVLTPLGLFVDPATYANAKQWALATGGYTMTLSGQVVTFPTDAESTAFMNGKASRLAQPNPPATINWQAAAGFVTLSAADFMTAAVAVADFVQATFDELKAVLAAVAAGTITTPAQVDTAAWPANHA